MATVTATYKITISYASTLEGHQPPYGNTNGLYTDLWSKLTAKATVDPFYFGTNGVFNTVNYTFDSNQQPNAVTFTVEGGTYAKRILDIAKTVTY